MVCHLRMCSDNRSPDDYEKRMEKKPGICKISFHKRAYLEEGDAFTVSLFCAKIRKISEKIFLDH